MLELLDFWKGLPKWKQPGRGKQGENKIYETLLSHRDDPLIPVKLRLFEEIAGNLNEFLARSQTNVPMVPFLVDSLENLTHNFAEELSCQMFWRKLITQIKSNRFYRPKYPKTTIRSKFS